MSKWDQLADDATIEKTIKALKANGIDAQIVNTSEEAKKKVLELIPPGSEVMTMTSMTCEAIGILPELNESGNYRSVRQKFGTMDRNTQKQEMSRLGAAPEVTTGSVHAVTQDGNVLIASASGSQLPAYAYGAGKVVWIVGAQKIVKNTDEGFKRISEYTLPLENARALKAYGVGSGINKVLIINKETTSGRIFMIIVKEKLGF